MITYHKLGKMCRLGNQLFQVASTIGIAVRNGYEYKFPIWEFSDRFKHPIPQGEIKFDQIYKHDYVNHFHYKDIIVDDNTSIWGFLHSEKYFKHCSDLIRYYFTPADDIRERIEDKYFFLLEHSSPKLAISVRRGDYLHHDDFPVMPAQYFNNAIKYHFNNAEDCTVVVFSDDILWCKENIKGYPEIVYVEDNDNPDGLYARHGKAFTDLFLMTYCDAYIISPSTFSWWGAWLSQNPGAIVIAPEKWFIGSRSERNISDVYPSHWEKLNNEGIIKEIDYCL